MKIIFGKEKELRSLIIKHPYVVVHYCVGDCPELVDNFIGFSTKEKYKDIIFIKMDAKKIEPVKKMVQEYQKPLVAIYRKGALIDSKSVESKKEMQVLLDKLIKAK